MTLRKIFLKKRKKTRNFDINYRRRMVQPLDLLILRCSFKNVNVKKLPPTAGVLPLHTQKLYFILLLPH